MAFTVHFRMATDKEKSEAVARLVKLGTGDFDFYLFIVLAVSMAALGLILNSPEVIIGSMLIAPALFPILSLALGLVLSDLTLALRSARTLLFSLLVAVFVAWGLTFLLDFFIDVHNNAELLKRATPSVLYFVVACVSGFAATYALIHANLNETLPGIAISVSLMPPLAAVGVSVAFGEYPMALGALILFLLNVLGIVVASMLALTFADMYKTHTVVSSAIHQEEKRLAQEKRKMEALSEETEQNNHV